MNKIIIFLAFLASCGATDKGPKETQNSPEDAIHQVRMVEHLKGRGIRNPGVIAAMLAVPRHEFVPARYRDYAYEVRPLPIGLDQTISSPFIVAYMTEVADLTPDEKVLEIGTGSGYQAAVLAEMTDSVYSIEILPALADQARARLPVLGYPTIQVRTGNGYLGWPEDAPFDAIVVTAAPDEIPQTLVDQLAVGGRMVIPVGTDEQEMVVITRTPTGVVEKRTLRVRFVPMTGKPKPK
jgi:protein-L-isoaspartate(D-aspartate) O-methyltransferase